MVGAALRRRISRCVGWLADRRIPTFLRAPVYRSYSRITGARPEEAALALSAYPSLGAFFVRRLAAGARVVDERPGVFVSPCDGRVQALGRVERGATLQAKGRSYALDELLDGAAAVEELEGGSVWTIYLGPRDYHRVHAPVAGGLGLVRWVPGDRRSVAPAVLGGRDRVLATNERVVLRLDADWGPCWLVMVGALNVGRIRVVGVEPGSSPPVDAPPRFERGGELARFEMGSTVVLVLPPGGPRPVGDLEVGARVTLGQAIGTWTVAENPRSESTPVP